MTSLFLFFLIVASATAAPVDEIDDNQLIPVLKESEAGSGTISEQTIDSSMREVETSYGSSTDQDLGTETNSKSLPATIREPKLQRGEIPTLAQMFKQAKTAPKKGRNHKAIFVDYPFVPQLSNLPNFETYDELDGERRTLSDDGALSNAQRKRYQESNIYYVRLPPTPYMFVPGLGYVSQPPTYSTGHLRPSIPHLRPQLNPYRPQNGLYNSAVNEINPFINLPVDFVSNGKPTGVYQWQSTSYQPIKRPESQITTLDKGPYFFNGRPQSIYLLRPDDRPPIGQTLHQYPDYQDTNLYY